MLEENWKFVLPLNAWITLTYSFQEITREFMWKALLMVGKVIGGVKLQFSGFVTQQHFLKVHPLAQICLIVFRSFNTIWIFLPRINFSFIHSWWRRCCLLSLCFKRSVLLVAIPLVLPPVPVKIWCLAMLGCCHSLHQHPTLYSPTSGRFSQASPLQVRWIIWQ